MAEMGKRAGGEVMIWLAGKFNNHVASLGNGLTLHVQKSLDPLALHRDLCWEVIVFGKKQENCRELEEAKQFAELIAKAYLNAALRVLEGK